MRAWSLLLASAIFTFATRCPPGSVYSKGECAYRVAEVAATCEGFPFDPTAALHTDPLGALWNALVWCFVCCLYAASVFVDWIVPLEFMGVPALNVGGMGVCVVDHVVDAFAFVCAVTLAVLGVKSYN